MRPGRPLPARLLVALLLSVLLGLTACGGQEIKADEVPGPPADLPLPGGGETTATPDGTATPTPTPTATPEEGADAGGASATPEPDAAADAGAATGDTAVEADSPDNDQPPPAGSDAERFEEFCDANPGAC